MVWLSAFYFGNETAQTVLLPIEAISFEVVDMAGFEAREQPGLFETADSTPAFDFTGKPVFQPIDNGADFNVEC